MIKKIIILVIILTASSTWADTLHFSEGVCQNKLSQNLRAPIGNERLVQNGKYNSYTKSVVTEAHILQEHLNRLGFNSGIVDGKIGPVTKRAILKLQAFLGTTQDGYIGPKTRALLNNSCGEKENTKTQKNIVKDNEPDIYLSDITSIMSKDVYDKISHGDVTRLQKFLQQEGYSLDIDGYFGPGTESVVKKYTLDTLGTTLNYFDPRLFSKTKKISEKEYAPKKIHEYLGYGKFSWFTVDFPFAEEKIQSVYCGKAKKDFMFKNEKIIFPISKNGPGIFTCTLNAELDGKNKIFEIVDVHFTKIKRPTTHVTLNGSYSKPPTQEILDKIAADNALTKKAYADADPKIKFDSPFMLPMDTEMISPFGKTRIFNGTRTSVHSGTDYRARTPLPVKAINDGEVIVAGVDLYYCGKGVIINHGMNIFSAYCHLSENHVQTGDVIQKGDIIGLTGETGRVSGPHLHMSVKYNGGYVDFEELQKKSEISFR